MQQVHPSIGVLSVVSLLALGGAGCGGSGSSVVSDGAPMTPTMGSTGTLALRVTDAPFHVGCFAEATVVVDRIEIQPTGEQDALTLTTTAQTYNLLDLAGGVSATAGFATLPAGRYRKIRLAVSQAVLTWNEPAPQFQRAYMVPGAVIEIVPAPEIVIVADQTTSVLLDFDLASSFAEQGVPAATCEDLKQAGKLAFAPVVRALNLDAAGGVRGNVMDTHTASGFPGVTVSASDGTDPPAATVTTDGSQGDEVGSYALFLAPGTYTLTFEAAGRPMQTTTVTVETGREARADATMP